MNSDILVIGGGVIGLATAWKLAKAGKKVIVLEKNTCAECTSTVAPGALMPYNPSREDALPAMQHQSLALYSQFIQALEEDSGINVKYTRNGRVQPIQSIPQRQKMEQDVQLAAEKWPTSDNKPPMELLDDKALKAIEPNVEPSPFGALYCRVSGHIHTDLLVKALYQACKNLGVTIVENSEAQLNVHNGTIQNVTTTKETFHADKVLIAAGAWSSKIFQTTHIIMPLKGQVIHIETPEPLLNSAFVRAKGLYIIQSESNKIIVGATKESDAGFDTKVNEESSQKMFDKACTIVPKLKKCRITNALCGLRPMSVDKVPLMDEIPNVANLYVSAGHGGIGICMTPIASDIMAEKLLS
jgi:glycine oxidase